MNLFAPITAIGAAVLGAAVLGAARETGRVSLFAARAASAMASPPWHLRQLGVQLARIGFLSLPVVGLTALFTGAALALNIYSGGARADAEAFVPNIVVVGITRELGPVLAALMLAGRVSAAIAAEIGTMRVTEQVDALVTLSSDPHKYLIAPRILAGILALPLLVAAADILGVFGGYVVATQSLGYSGPAYIQNTLDFVTRDDIVSGLIKAAVFGFILTLMGCYHGFTSSGGARGVGQATRNAVVSAAILIFAANYLLTSFFVHR